MSDFLSFVRFTNPRFWCKIVLMNTNMKKSALGLATLLLFGAVGQVGCGATAENAANTQTTQSQTKELPADTTAPEFTFSEDFEIEEGDSVAYKSHVQATDDSGEEPEITVDNSNVDPETPGTYQVTYTATDAAGNSSTVTVTMTVTEAAPYSEKKVGPMVDEIIASVTTEDMSEFEIAEALYWWVKDNISYSAVDSETENIWEGAYQALNDRKGDCFTYYAIYAALLTRAGIENMCVTRVNGPSDHYWNLVNFGEGWYHCDTGPGSSNYRITCFMQTDAQLESYDAWDEECHEFYQFDGSILPERATKIIYGPETYGN